MPSGRAARITQQVLFNLLWIAILFGSAGTLDWLRGWIFVGLSCIAMAVLGLVMKKFNPGLIEARARFRHANTKGFDRIIMALYLPLILIQPAIAGIDAVRFHWTSMPFWCVYAGGALMIPTFALVAWTFAVNPFAETTVRIQTERGQKVIDFGPYRFVRHPMYVAIILIHVAGPLVQGSLWALALAVPIAILFVVRTALEDRALRDELPGYDAYTARTRYRLVPGIW
jgi:protein-S-isoprenylcysteine O-methyltransferase Ste14